MTVLTFPFTYFFDTDLTPYGFMYAYFWALPQAVIVYFVAFRLRARGSSTILFGLQGIVGAPVDYYLDWVVQQNLIGPLYALLYVPLFFLVGAVADVSLMWLRPESRPGRASTISAFAFTSAVLAMWTLATVSFYPWPGTFEGSWLMYGDFLIPYALATGALGGYVGFSLARDRSLIWEVRTRAATRKRDLPFPER